MKEGSAVREDASRGPGGRGFPVALVDLALLLGSFFLLHLSKYGTVEVSHRHAGFFFLVLVGWLILGVMLRKFSHPMENSLRESLGVAALHAGLMTGLVSLFIVLLGLTGMSRLVVYGTFGCYFLAQVVVLLVYYFYTAGSPANLREIASMTVLTSSSPSMLLVVFDGIVLLWAFYLVTLLKRGFFQWSDYNLDLLFMLVGVWIVTSVLARKYERENYSSPYAVFNLVAKSTFFMAAGLAVMIIAFHDYYLSRGQLFGTVAVFAVFEMGLFILYYRYRSYQKGDVQRAWRGVMVPLSPQVVLPAAEQAPEGVCADPVDQKLRHALQFLEPELYDFMREHVDLETVDSGQTALMHSSNLFNVRILDAGRYQLLVNLHKVNDLRFLNQYFLLAHDKLRPAGWLVGKAHTLDTRGDMIQKRFPRPAREIMYTADFIWNRVMPKMPLAKKFYFALTQGRNRLLSKAEILGRLHFCGFHSVAETVMNERYYFIARKVMTPSNNPDPTYGPVVKLHRTGFQGRPITVYKFRTMHPYSEYLQEYVYEHNQLKEGGKFKDDFRVTGWGLVMRKLWIDELPMLYNWLRGDLQLVGVRPLSRQYLELYSPELRELRKKVKPGMVPPFYADMPTTFEEICESERRYIEEFLKRPFRTQWRYFWKAFWNIAVKGARSG